MFPRHFGILHWRILLPAVIGIGSVDRMREADLLFNLIINMSKLSVDAEESSDQDNVFIRKTISRH